MFTVTQARSLTVEERQIFKPYFSLEILEKARIIDGHVPFWLRSDMCAVVLKHCIYFRPNVYQPNTLSGVKLLGHELTHVAQFFAGMNWFTYCWSCRYGYRNSPYEKEAITKANQIAAKYQQIKEA